MYVERTLVRDGVAIVGQFRDDGDGAARFEGAFVAKKGDRFIDEDGVVWTVSRVRQADVAKKQAAYAWCDLRNVAARVADEGGPEAVDVTAVEPEPDPENEPEAVEDDTPAPVKKRGKRTGGEADADA